jgi:uncharacterized protein (TIGR01777 family)
MKILMAGGTGFIGKQLTDLLMKHGHELVLLTRSAGRAAAGGQPAGALVAGGQKARFVTWEPDDETSIVQEVNDVDAVINLAGEPIVGKRWTRDQKEKILTSRVNATQILARSVERAVSKPKVFLNASGIGFYGPRGSEILTEDSRAGDDFLANVCKAWEAEALRAEAFRLRVVRLRIGVVLAEEGGALAKLLPLFKMFLGGWIASGNQWMSWIHMSDLLHLIEYCLIHNVQGSLNAAAPQAVTNKAFSFVLAQVLKRPCLLPVPAFVLKMMMGEAADVLFSGQRVIPKAALKIGFAFRFPEIRQALEDILKKAG